MSGAVLEAGTAQPDSRSREFNLYRVHPERGAVSGQLSKDGEWAYSRGLLRGLQTRLSAEYSDDGNSSSLEPAGYRRSDLAAFLSRAAGEQFPVLDAAADSRVVSENVYASVYLGGWNLTRRLRDTGNSVVHVFCFDLQLLLAGFANPVMLPVDEGMIVDTFAVIFRAQIAFHYLVLLTFGIENF